MKAVRAAQLGERAGLASRESQLNTEDTASREKEKGLLSRRP